MTEHNKLTGKWDYHVPVDATCLGSRAGCPAAYPKSSESSRAYMKSIEPSMAALERMHGESRSSVMMQLFPELVQEDFDDVYDLRFNEVIPITTEQAIHLHKTDVVLVRSRSLPDMGDHYIVVTGHAVQKDHGVRPQTAVFPAMPNSPLLDMYDTPGTNVVLLKLNNTATQAFLNHYGIHLDEGCNVVSETYQLEMI